MLTKLIRSFLVLLLFFAFLPVSIVLADTGPKPTMEFAFKQEATSTPITIDSGTLYECEQSDCSDAAPLQQLGPQGFFCDAQGCRATSYGFRPYHKIEIQFSDGKTRQSNIFQTAGFNSKYTVTVRPDDLLVEAQLTPGNFPFPSFIVIT